MNAKFIFAMAFILCEVASANPWAASSTDKWNGAGIHPFKKLKFLESDETGGCEFIYVYYHPKGAVTHSPKTAYISSAFCMASVTHGSGALKEDYCEVLEIDFVNGGGKPFYGGQARLAKKGECDSKRANEFLPEIKRQYQAVQKVGLEVGVQKDKINFKNSFLSFVTAKEPIATRKSGKPFAKVIKDPGFRLWCVAPDEIVKKNAPKSVKDSDFNCEPRSNNSDRKLTVGEELELRGQFKGFTYFEEGSDSSKIFEVVKVFDHKAKEEIYLPVQDAEGCPFLSMNDKAPPASCREEKK